MSRERIMTTKELAGYIKLNEKTVIKMAQSGELPGVKIGAQWRFHAESIDAYMQNDIVKSKDEDLDLIINTEMNIIPLSRLIREDLICVDLKSVSSKDVLVELVDIASHAGLVISQKKLISELKKREKMLSTAIGNGVAIPHPRHPSGEFFKNPNIILGCSKKGVDFKAPDKKLVHLFFMTCAPNEFVHLRLLSKISKFLHAPDIIHKCMKANSKDEIIQTLLEFERDHFFSTVNL